MKCMKRIGRVGDEADRIYIGLAVVSPYLASLVWQVYDQLYHGYLSWALDYSPISAFRLVTYFKPVQALAIMIMLAGIIFTIMISNPQNDLSHVKGKTIKITDKIRIPARGRQW